MKKLFVAFTVALIATMAANNKLVAQQTGGKMIMEAVTATAIDMSTRAGKDLNKEEINTKALRHFEKSFKNAKDVKWMGLADGYVARFAHNDIIERIFYSTKGNLAGSLKGYTADNMPLEVSNAIEVNYAGYAITYVDEASVVNVPGVTAYIVHLLGIQNLKVVRVIDGEIDVLFDSDKNVSNPKRF